MRCEELHLAEIIDLDRERRKRRKPSPKDTLLDLMLRDCKRRGIALVVDAEGHVIGVEKYPAK